MTSALSTRRPTAGEVSTPPGEEPAPAPSAELHRLMLALRERYPDVPPDTIAALVVQSHGDLAGSRIQAFRMVLTERAVRRHLTARPTTESRAT